MKQNKSIATILDLTAMRYRESQKIKKFFTTKRGKTFVNKIHTASIKELCNRYKAPKCIQNAEKNKINIFNILYELNMADREYYKNGNYKYTIHKKPHVNLFDGNKQEKPKQTALTVEEHKAYNIAHSPRKMGFAALMHAYEEHKMKKFEKLHPAPTERELKEDLFPEELLRAWDTMMTIHREYVRNMLCDTYYNKGLPIFCKNRDDFYKLYVVYNRYEKEGDPYVVGYPFTDTRVWNQYTLIDKVKEKLQIKANYYCADSDAIGLRVYNKYGIPIAYSTIPRKNFEKT